MSSSSWMSALGKKEKDVFWFTPEADLEPMGDGYRNVSFHYV